MNTLQIRQVGELLSNKSINIVIVCHVNPDGDAIGSSLGLYQYLRNALHDNVWVIAPNSHAAFLEWMPNNDVIINATKNSALAKEVMKKAEVVFCLDFNDLERTEQLSGMIRKSNAKRILIDHHPDPVNEFDITFSTTKASSTSELIYDFIVSMGHRHLLDKSIAACLYAGIITDTGSFSYSCNNPKTYKITAHLIEQGIDGEYIHRQIYDTYSEERMRLLGHCLSERLVVNKKYKTAYIYLSDNDLKQFKHKDGDTEGVVNYALSIKEIQLAAIFIEKKDTIKISFRSVGDLNVNKLARRYFKGGGHRNAAGGNYKDSLENALIFFNEILPDISKDNFRVLKDIQYNP